MIYLCPFCGRNLSRPIQNGITTCDNCQRVFDSSSYHCVLAAAWYVRRHNIYDIETISSNFELNEAEAEIIQKYVIDEDCSHDELIKIVKQDQ